MTPMKTTLLAGLALAVTAMPAAAHHSGSMYDSSKAMTIKGVVKELVWVNPHASLQFIADPGMPEAGKIWVLEMTSPGALTRVGWSKRSLKAGDHVEMLVWPLRSGGPAGQLMTVKNLQTGETLGGMRSRN